jgi:hypothetical protein
VTTVLNATESAVQKYDYDSRQLLLRSQSAEGVVAEFEYNQQGYKIRESNNLAGTEGNWTDAEGDTGRIHEQKWKYDYFGRMTDHNDLSGHDYNYGYNAGMQVSQTAAAFATAQEADLNWWQAILSELYATGIDIETAALNRTTEYYANGLVKKISDVSGTYLYEYDANGNRTMEESTAIDGRGTSVHVRTRVEYDSHNRVTRVTTYNFGTPAAGGQPAVAARYELDLAYSYDAMGNRRRVTSLSGYSGYADTENGHGSVTTAPISVGEGAIRVTDATLDLRTFRSGQAGAFTIRMADVFQDPEGRLPTYAAVAAPGSTWPDWLVASYDAQSGVFTFLTTNAAAANLNQTFTIQLRATDPSNGAVVTSNVSVKVVGTSGTGPVAIDATVPTFNATTGQPLSLSLLASDYFRDSDVGEVLTLSVDTPLPPWMSVENDGDAVRLTGLPTAGLHTITLRATDSNNNTVIRTIKVQGVANAGPAANAVPLQYIDADGPMALDAPLQALFTDADPLTLTAKMQDGTQLPAWLLFQYEPGALPRVRLNGEVPAGLAVGTQFNVVITAVDPSGLSASTTITLQVGDPPAVEPGPTPPPLVNNFNADNVTLHAGQSIVLPANLFSRGGENVPYDLRVAVWIEGSSGSPYYNQEIKYTEDAPHWELRSLPDTMLWDPETRTITATADTYNMGMTLVVAPTALGFFKFTRGVYTNQMFQTFGLTVDQGLTGAPLNREDYWYTYDAENRVQVVNGRMIDGDILLRDENMYDASYDGPDGYMVNASLDPSYMQTYDAAGRAIGRTHLNIDGGVMYQQSIYTQRGELAATFGDRGLDAFDGDATAYGAGIAQTYVYDTAGRLTSQDMYFDPTSQNGDNPLGYVRGGQKFWYDKDGQMTRQEDWGKAEGDTDPDLDLLSVTTQVYDSVGRLGSRFYDHSAWETRPHNPGEDPPDVFRHTFSYTYEGRDGYLEKSVTGSSNTEYYRETTSTSTYDAMGRRIAVQEHTPLPEDLGEMEDRIRFFAYDAGNGILLRREGTLDDNDVYSGGGTVYERERNAHHYTYVNGQSVAHLTEGGDMDVTSRLTAFDTQSGAGTVVVQENDTLQRIAQRVYGNAGMWYVIAEANAIEGNDDLIAGTTLRTPSVKTVANTADTYRPYDPSQVIGPTTPDLPWIAPPPKAGCGAFAIILMIVVMVVITICTAGAAAPAAAGTFSSVWGAGAAVLGGAGGLAGAGAAALGAFVGSVAGQAVGSLMGVTSFSWRSAFAAGATSFATAGIGGLAQAGKLGSFLQATKWARVATTAVAGNLAGYAANKIAGGNQAFSWKSVAASAVTAALSSKLTDSLRLGAAAGDSASRLFMKDMTSNAIQGVVGLHVRRQFGFDDDVDYGMIALDSFGNALANSFASSAEARTAASKPVRLADGGALHEDGTITYGVFAPMTDEEAAGGTTQTAANYSSEDALTSALAGDVLGEEIDMNSGLLVAGPAPQFPPDAFVNLGLSDGAIRQLQANPPVAPEIRSLFPPANGDVYHDGIWKFPSFQMLFNSDWIGGEGVAPSLHPGPQMIPIEAKPLPWKPLLRESMLSVPFAYPLGMVDAHYEVYQSYSVPIGKDFDPLRGMLNSARQLKKGVSEADFLTAARRLKLPMIVQVNGINNSYWQSVGNGTAIASERRALVVNVYNPTHGFIRDVVGSGLEIGGLDTAVSVAAAHAIRGAQSYNRIAFGKGAITSVYGHSEGTALTNRAVSMLNGPERSRIDLYNFGTATGHVPQGLHKFRSVENTWDFVPMVVSNVAGQGGVSTSPGYMFNPLVASGDYQRIWTTWDVRGSSNNHSLPPYFSDSTSRRAMGFGALPPYLKKLYLSGAWLR